MMPIFAPSTSVSNILLSAWRMLPPSQAATACQQLPQIFGVQAGDFESLLNSPSFLQRLSLDVDFRNTTARLLGMNARDMLAAFGEQTLPERLLCEGGHVRRIMIERALLNRDTPESAGFRKRAEKFPGLMKWLSLGNFDETVDIPVSAVRNRMEQKLAELLSRLRRIYSLIDPNSRPSPDEMCISALEGHELGARLLSSDIDRNTLFAADLDYLDHTDELIALIHTVLRDLVSLPRDGSLRYKISLWSRRAAEKSALKLPPGLEDDLGCHLIKVSMAGRMQSVVADGVLMRLFTEGESLVLCVSDLLGGKDDHWNPAEFIQPTIEKIIRKISDEVGIVPPARRLKFPKARWTQPPPVPAMVPGDAEEAIQTITKNVAHPDIHLLAWPRASFEALGFAREPKVNIRIPWWGNLPREFAGIWGREIVTNPLPEDMDNYAWAFCSGTGRSIEIYFSNGYQTSDGTRWRRASFIGVGATSMAQSGTIDSDGLLPWTNALRRLHMTNFLHWAGLKLGVRTSLAVGLYDRATPDEKIDGRHAKHAVVVELCRETLRLWDLSPDPDLADRMLGAVRQRLSFELGLKGMSDEEYVSWLAGQIGIQCAILKFLRVDHGDSLGPPPKIPQFHPGNFTLGGEVRDFEQGRFRGASDTRYLRNFIRWSDHIDLEKIGELQRRALMARAGGGSIRADTRGTAGDKDIGAGGVWLAILLDRAPYVDFAGIAAHAYRKKMEELDDSGIDPVAALRKFNEEFWIPLMRNKKR